MKNNIEIKPDKIDINKAKTLIQPASTKRSWFNESLYEENDVMAANTAGLVAYTEYPFSIVWDGTKDQDGIKIKIDEDYEDMDLFPILSSDLGEGIITVEYPIKLEVEDNFKLVVTNPINYIFPGATVISSTINTNKNIKFYIKMQIPDLSLSIPKSFPLASILKIEESSFLNNVLV